MVLALITPHFSNAKSYAISEPAKAPVWLDAALAPASLTPDLIITTGFFLVALDTTSKNLSAIHA